MVAWTGCAFLTAQCGRQAWSKDNTLTPHSLLKELQCDFVFYSDTVMLAEAGNYQKKTEAFTSSQMSLAGYNLAQYTNKFIFQYILLIE